jgi:hypothetical protein
MMAPLRNEGVGPWTISKCNCDQSPALEQGQAERGKATAATQTFLVDTDEAPDRGSPARPCVVNLAIDSKLRGCDVVAIKVEDVAARG